MFLFYFKYTQQSLRNVEQITIMKITISYRKLKQNLFIKKIIQLRANGKYSQCFLKLHKNVQC